MKKLSIVVSVYNEEQSLGKFYNAFIQVISQINISHELIFVNDGSTDKSGAILRYLAKNDKNVKVIDFSRNFGHESAMIAGIDYAGGDAIICMDADLQHPVTCIPKIIEKLSSGYDIVNMVRKSNRSAGFIKNLTSSAFYKIINIFSKHTKFEKNASDFFAISRDVAQVLKQDYREKTRFLRGYVQDVGFAQTTLSYTAAERVGGSSHYSLKKLFDFSVNTITCFSDFPLKLGIYAGFISALIGIIVLIYSLITIKGAPSGYTTIVVLICFMFAVLFFMVGVIGQYIAVLFAEVKNRPIYIVKDTVNF